MSWFRARGEDAVPSPALLIHIERVERNIRRMLEIAGGPRRLWPHVKTHKLPQLAGLQVGFGIDSYKCATVAEAEMLASVPGVRRILLALQPVGPNADRLLHLIRTFPQVEFFTLVDCIEIAERLVGFARKSGSDSPIGLYLDLDVGQGRTGLPAGDAAAELAARLVRFPEIHLAGLHAYDGHLGLPDLAERVRACDLAFEPVSALKRSLEGSLGRSLEVIAGGSPTFRLHADRPEVSLSPGTTVLWDAGYSHKLPDLPFEPAAVLVTRVVSKPSRDRLCLDVGHKAVASEMPAPRMEFLDLEEVRFISHSEEHLVVESPMASETAIGDVFHAVPWHVCPTVALHSEIWTVRDGRVDENWAVAARARRLSI